MSNEHSEQVGFITWFRNRYPSILIFHIPNGEYRSISVAKRLKAAGVVAGIPDLYIPRYHLWIEMKTETGKLSKDQEAMHTYLRRIGDTVFVAHGAEDASRQFLEFLK